MSIHTSLMSALVLAATAFGCRPVVEAPPVRVVDPSLRLTLCNENPETATLWVQLDVTSDRAVTIEAIELMDSPYVGGRQELSAPVVVEAGEQVTLSCVNGFEVTIPPQTVESARGSVKVHYRIGSTPGEIATAVRLVKESTWDNCQNVIGVTEACHGE